MRSVALLVSTVVLVGCSTVAGRIGGTPGEDWDAELTPQGGSSVRGTVTAKSGVGGTTSTIQIRGAMAGATHPWHIHRGDCGSNGAIVGEASAYPPLVVGADGLASATASIGPDIDTAQDDDYYVNVHASPQNMASIIACGELDED